MPEKIDTLTLDIGLTSEEFQAGVDKILGSMERMQGSAAETGKSMGASFASLGSSVASLAWRFAGMFLAFKSIEGLVDYFKDLSVELGNLGFASKYLGQSGVELRRFGEVAELSGGKAQDAIAAVQGLNAAIFGLEFQGQVSQSLIMFSRLRVPYLSPTGAPLPLKEQMLNAAKALQEQFPGKENQWFRQQYAQQLFPGAPGISNAVSGPLEDFEKHYARATKDNKDITQRLIDRQMELQESVISLSYTLKDTAAKRLDQMTDALQKLIRAIEDKLIPTIDELISDVMDWMHPERLVDKAMSSPEGVGPLIDSSGIHPISIFEAMGIGLGIRFAQYYDWYKLHGGNLQGQMREMWIPPQITSRLPPGVNTDALKLLHIEAGGDEGDPTWSKTIAAYGSLLNVAGGAESYVQSALSSQDTTPHSAVGVIPRTGTLSTPSAHRPSAAASGAAASKPTTSITGPRVQIGSMTINTQATDAMGIMADASRAVSRKFLVSQADPGLA